MSFDSWETVNLRLSVFFASGIDLSGNITWQSLFGTLPDTQNIQPKLGLNESSGEFEGGQLILQTSPGRADIIFQSPLSLAQIDSKSAVSASKSLNSFNGQAKMLLQKLKDLSDMTIERVAFGTELALQKEDRKSAYTALNNLLHEVNLDDESSDFQYSINRKRKSTTDPKIEINRLSIWKTIVINQFGNNLISFPVRYECRLTLDINTVPSEGISLQADGLEAIYDELVNLGIEITEYGDIS